jgi:hypothetical protein
MPSTCSQKGKRAVSTPPELLRFLLQEHKYFNQASDFVEIYFS